MENYIFVSNLDQRVGERKVAVVQNGKILINGTSTMSFSWRKFVSNLWDTASIPFVVPRRHTNRIYSPLPFGIDNELDRNSFDHFNYYYSYEFPFR